MAELKAKQRPRQGLSPETVENLQFLQSKAADAYATLRAADPKDKSELRRDWIAAREELERARIQAAKEARHR